MNYHEKDTILYLDDVSAGYGNPKDHDFQFILKDINFSIRDIIREGFSATGQNIAVVGRSGRGKSTLFRLLTGLLKPVTGRVLITDLNSTSKDDAKDVREGDFGFVDQKYTLFRHKTIQQIMLYALRKKNIPQKEKILIVESHLADWGLEPHKNKYPNELSGGQRQRTAIIEQILSSKHFLIFDEPTSGLDVNAIENLKKSFQLIHKENELNTIIFATHNIEFAVEMADTIIVVGHPALDSTFSTIVKTYDLKKLGLAWKEYDNEHLALVEDVKDIIRKT